MLDNQDILHIVLIELESSNINALLALGFTGFSTGNVDCSFEASKVKFILSNCCGVALLFFIDLKNNGVKEATAEHASIFDNALLESFHHFLNIASEDIREAMGN